MEKTQPQVMRTDILPGTPQSATVLDLTNLPDFQPNRKRTGRPTTPQQGREGTETRLDVTQAVRGQLSGRATTSTTPAGTETEPRTGGLGTYSEIFGHDQAKATAHTTKNSDFCPPSWADVARQGAKLAKLAQEREKQERLTRWGMLGAAGELRPGEQVARCMKHHQIRKGEKAPDAVTVQRSAELRAARFDKLMPCKSVWDCPICAAYAAKQRTDEVRTAGRNHREQGGGVLLVTLTVRHNAGTRLVEVLDRFTKAREWLREQRSFKDLMKRVECFGTIRALEVTHGVNGWHPHTHELLFTAASVSDQGEERTTPKGTTYTGISDLAQFRADYYRLWKRAARRHGLQINENGLHVTATDQQTSPDDWERLTGYMVDSMEVDDRTPEERAHDEQRRQDAAVFNIRQTLEKQRAARQKAEKAAQFLEFGGGWDAATELTAGTHKKARSKAGRTPMQLLADYALHDDQQAGELFREMSEAMKGEKQLVWSKGLKKLLLDAQEEVSEKEQAEDVEAEWADWVHIPREDWKQILRAGRAIRGEVEHYAATDDREAFTALIKELQEGKRKRDEVRSLRKKHLESLQAVTTTTSEAGRV